MRYIIFTRVATGKKAAENQTIECMNYVKENMKKNDEILNFDEGGVSTRKKMDERPVLKSMLEFLKKGDTLVVYKLNRLARAFRELVVIWYVLTKKGINLVSLYEKGVDEMMIQASGMLGQSKRRNFRESTISGLNRKKLKMEEKK